MLTVVCFGNDAANAALRSLSLVGGSMDGTGDAETGFTCRGEREPEARMECLWYVCSKAPSLQTPGRTISTREPIRSRSRLMHRQGQLDDSTGPQMSLHDSKRMAELLLTPEDELENLGVRRREFFAQCLKLAQ